jgi:hypothetical protein
MCGRGKPTVIEAAAVSPVGAEVVFVQISLRRAAAWTS